jgi:hypothetical protein
MTIEIIRPPKARVFHHIERGKLRLLPGRKYRKTDQTPRLRLIPGRSFCTRSKSAGMVQAEYLSLAELAVYASVCRNTLTKWLACGMPCYRVDRCIRVKKSDFDQWFRQFRSGTGSQDLDTLWSQILEEVQQ